MFECDVVAFIGFLTGFIVAGTIALVIAAGNVAYLSFMATIVPLAIFYISRRKEWLRKQEETEESLREFQAIKGKIGEMLKKYA